ncbi:MXAN_6640 family putative metalloprotease [Chondromyces crocatus]|uniref:Uncharacterized protein n=1 Tax=Chondromyces crocatus TaxID=52 RepID=A0A0K1E591_CHOCO|nr:MXAN_6640 family putative metalloprotease [Chondromyces crocatus]AKT36051.1 uncharacterized protein CMC5_001630 [Chondromyces crocatus]
MRSTRGAAFSFAVAILFATVGCGVDGEGAPHLGSPGFVPLDRPDTPGNTLLFRFAPGDVVDTYGSPSGEFLVHYTRDGVNAVPAADVDGSGVPDFVEEVGTTYDEVLAFYMEELGFRHPVRDGQVAINGGDARFDVYLVDFAGTGDGTFQLDPDGCSASLPAVCAGYMISENDFVGYGYPSTRVANRILASHELFHAVQAAYDAGQGSVLSEGSAVWATEAFDPALNDFEAFIRGYLRNPDRSLNVPLPGPVDPFSYGSALYFRFLDEHHGAGTVRGLWERCEDGAFGVEDPAWIEQIDPLLTAKGQGSFATSFVTFATWNLFTGSHADPARGYAQGASYEGVTIEAVAAPFSDRLRSFYASTQYYRVPVGDRAEMTAALVPQPDTPEDVEGLTLLLVPEQGSTYGSVTQVEDPAAGAEVIDVRAHDALVVAVVNGLTRGSSRRPTLCIGSPDEVKACADEVSGGGGDGGSGGGDGGSGAGGEEPAPRSDRMDDAGCGCRAAGGAAATGEGAGLLAAVALAAAGYRRRRRPA